MRKICSNYVRGVLKPINESRDKEPYLHKFCDENQESSKDAFQTVSTLNIANHRTSHRRIRAKNHSISFQNVRLNAVTKRNNRTLYKRRLEGVANNESLFITEASPIVHNQSLMTKRSENLGSNMLIQFQKSKKKNILTLYDSIQNQRNETNMLPTNSSSFDAKLTDGFWQKPRMPSWSRINRRKWIEPKKRNGTKFVPFVQKEENIVYEGDKIIDYVDLFDKIKFDCKVAKIENGEDIDESFLSMIKACNNRNQMWKSTLKDKIYNFNKIDKLS